MGGRSSRVVSMGTSRGITGSAVTTQIDGRCPDIADAVINDRGLAARESLRQLTQVILEHERIPGSAERLLFGRESQFDCLCCGQRLSGAGERLILGTLSFLLRAIDLGS